MKKIMVCMGMLAGAFLFIYLLRDRENRLLAVQSIAGEGMTRLVAEQMEAPRIALTFDDGPSKKYSPLLLDGLKERGVQVSFFLLGRNIQGNEDLVQRMQQEGHLIGNHTYNHVELNKISLKEAKEEIEKTGNKIFEITGIYPVYVRPPFGEWREDLNLSVELLNVPWNIDTLDWKTKNADNTVEIVKQQVKDGSIVLMHDGYESSVKAALRIIDLLTKEGFEFVTVDKLLMV